jgi:NADPH2:quinone reductase
MKAVVYETTGPSSVLRLVGREPVVPGPGEVRVRVVVSGVNPTDWTARQGSGDGKALPAAPGAQPKWCRPGGGGGTGGHRARGEPANLAVGRCLAAGRWHGPRADQPARRQVVALPDEESYDTGASLGIPALTAHRALTTHET